MLLKEEYNLHFFTAFFFSFGLFEAMSAIEMMDPKMDAGMVCNQAKRKVLNFSQATEVRVNRQPR